MSRWPLWLKIVIGVFVALSIISLVGNLGGNARDGWRGVCDSAAHAAGDRDARGNA
jgi:hypothetical protein